MVRAIAFSAVFILALLVAGIVGQPPSPMPDDTPATEFSAMRAMTDVEIIAQRPHPTGSADILRVRQYLRDRLAALDVELIPDKAQQPFYVPGFVARTLVSGNVHNVIGILKGTEPELPALLLMSHYDTVQNSPGAADDTAGVAAMLEIVANLKARGTLKRDVIILFTESEEAGLLGARAFFTEDPLAKRVGLAVNLEARGGSGRALMFETSRNAGGLVSAYGNAVSSPAANSLTAFVYRVMPNGTDLIYALETNIPGMNFAFIADERAYHTAYATPDHLDSGSLQHLGDQVLALTASLGNADDLNADAPDIIYGDFFGLTLISYSVTVGWLLVAILALQIGSTIWYARTSRMIGLRDVAKGFGFFILLFVVEVIALLAVGYVFMGLFDIQSKYTAIGRYDFFQGGFVAVALGVALLLLSWRVINRRLTLWGTWLGGVTLLFVLTLIQQILAPGTTVAIAWPLICVTLALLPALMAAKLRSESELAYFMILPPIFIGALFVTTYGAAIFLGLGGLLPAVLALPAFVAAIVLFPGLDALARMKHASYGAGCVLVLGLASVAWAAFGPASADHPRLTQAYYLAGPGANDYAYVSSVKRLDDWSHDVLTSDGGTPEYGALTPGYRQPAWRAAAKPAAVPRPLLDSNVQPIDGGQLITLKIKPGGTTPREFRFIMKAESAITDFALNGKLTGLKTEPGEWAQFMFSAPTTSGLTISFTSKEKGEASLRVFEVSDGWPDGVAVPEKPEGFSPWLMSDTTYAASALDVNWPAP